MPYYRIVAWKNRLMSKLDQGFMDVKEWERFIAISSENSCTSMAEDMRKRLEYYAGIIKQQTGA